MGHAQVEVTYTFYGPEGDSFTAKVPGEAMDVGDKATSKAMSVAYRTVLIQALNLPTGDPEPDSSDYERSSRAPQELPMDDPWRAKVGATGSVRAADALLAELRNLVSNGTISREYAGLVRDLLDARVALLRKHEAGTGQQSRQDAAPGDSTSTGAPVPAEGPAEEWAQRFRAMLAAVKASSDLDGKRGEIGRAVVDRLITSETATTLAAELAARRNELERQAGGSAG
jgi:hypothetical protein